jgi:hypothetical protein
MRETVLGETPAFWATMPRVVLMVFTFRLTGESGALAAVAVSLCILHVVDRWKHNYYGL